MLMIMMVLTVMMMRGMMIMMMVMMIMMMMIMMMMMLDARCYMLHAHDDYICFWSNLFSLSIFIHLCWSNAQIVGLPLISQAITCSPPSPWPSELQPRQKISKS
jgi:hypothetical protein